MNSVKIVGSGTIAEVLHEKITQLPVEVTNKVNADVYVLCLKPRDTYPYIQQIPKGSKILDTSYLYRCNQDWVYGSRFTDTELLINADKVANAGCIATGVNLLLKPLSITENIVVNAFCGHSVGGKRFDNMEDSLLSLSSSKDHPHVAEIRRVSGTDSSLKVVILPIVLGEVREGLLVEIVLFSNTYEDVLDKYKSCYADKDGIELYYDKAILFVSLKQHTPALYVNKVGQAVKISCLYSNLYYAGVDNLIRNLKFMLKL